MNNLDDEILNKDIYTLLHGMFTNQLPPLIDEILNEKSCVELHKKLEECNTGTFLFEDKFMTKLNKNIKTPNYVYGDNWAAESIKFFTVKKDDTWRPMAIPNLKHAIMFMENSILVSSLGLNDLYSKEERLNGKTSNSESPIIGRDGMISAMLYEEDSLGIDINATNPDDQAIGYIGYNDTNLFFEENKLQRFNMEKTYPYILEIDLSKFFENIYTHLLDKISENEIFRENKYIKKYLKWLDVYNQKINDNHTKGIIQGPISSKISAELLQLSLDQLIKELISKNDIDIKFTRYVDDYRFYARNYSDLELIKNHLTKLFRKYELSVNTSKIKIYKGFEMQKQAHLDKCFPIKNLINGNTVFKFKDYMILRDILIQLIDEADFATMKSVLTILIRKVNKHSIKFNDNELVISLIMFLIKLSYVKPILASKIYPLIKSISNNANKTKIWSILIEEMEYIEEHFSDTDLETWYFYVIANIGDSSKILKAFKRYHNLNKDTKTLSVLVLTVFLKRDSKKTNHEIENLILNSLDMLNKENQKHEEYIQETVSQTKWWLPIAKLWIVNDRNVNEQLEKLFVTKNNKIVWDKLGIIEFLLRKSKKGSQFKLTYK